MIMQFRTPTGQTLEDYFSPRCPEYLKEILREQLVTLALCGRDCINATVFKAEYQEELFYFNVWDEVSPQKMTVYIVFMDVRRIIQIVSSETEKIA